MSATGRIVLVSVLGLFLEMMLIRWIGAEIRIFAYLQNTLLVACFLGLGLGCFTSRRDASLRQVLIPVAVLVGLLAVPQIRFALNMVPTRLAELGGLVIWETMQQGSLPLAAAALGILFFLLVLVVDLFVPIGRLLGRELDGHPSPIVAYSINVAGSLVGIWLFAGLSAAWAPPVVWIAVLAALMLPTLFVWGQANRLNVALLAVILVLSYVAGKVPGALDVVWSPYQKLVVTEGDQRFIQVGQYEIDVNGVPYQSMIDLRPGELARDPVRYPPSEAGLSQYDLPLLFHPHPRTYLVVGGGTGNDAAGGLRHGVPQITMVEIDPAIIALGRRLHPERPYDSAAVTVVNDDARSFFAHSRATFDVITFGLLDSHTTATMTNARLDHFVYTRESLQQARRLLAPHGVMVLSFEAQKPYIADRMARVLAETFGEKPLAFTVPAGPTGYGGVMFVAGDLATARAQIAADPRLAAHLATLQARRPLSLPLTTEVITDDWPYVYLESRSVPPLYGLLAVLMIAVLVRSLWHWQAPGAVTGWRRSEWQFFLLGAAFMLLEVQGVTKAAVVLGNTWQTNAVIVSGVLAMALASNFVALRWRRLGLAPVYVALLATVVILYFVDVAAFTSLPPAGRIVAVGGALTAPILFSGVIFARAFESAPQRDVALGANLVGSLVGGLLQSVAFVTGIGALLVLVAILYALSAAFAGPVREANAI